jgi:aryl carrier-like protein
MDTNSFKNMLEVYKSTPAFFGGELAAALEEAKQLDSVEVIPLTIDSIIITNRRRIQEVLEGTGYHLVDDDDIVTYGLQEAEVDQLEEALRYKVCELYQNIDGYYFRDQHDLLEFIKDNITLE